MATLLVNDMGAAVSAIEATGGSVLEGPDDGPNGPRMIAHHGDGALFEYIELTR